MTSKRYEKHAPNLVELGYDVTPVAGKKPILTGWTDRPDNANDYSKFPNNSIGVLTGGGHNLIAVDVDILNPFTSNAVQDLIESELGFAPRRIGKQPKFLMVFRTDEQMRKIKTPVYDIHGDDTAVEILAEGQQFVASGIHEDTKKKYYWPDDSIMDIPANELTLVTVKQVEEFLALANELLSKHGTVKSRTTFEDGGGGKAPTLNLKEQDAPLDDISVALAHIPNDGCHYDDWIIMAHAVKGAVGADGWDIFDRWSQRSDKYDHNETKRAWNSIGKVDTIGAGSIFHIAAQYDFDSSEHRGSLPSVSVTEEIEQQEKTPTFARPVKGFDPRSINPRKWIVEGRYIRQRVTITIAPPGVGKSTLTIQEALAVAAGQDFGGRGTCDKGRVWIYNNEDDYEELMRRVVAAASFMGIPWSVVEDKVYINSGEQRPLCVATEDPKTGEVITLPDVQACIDECQRENIILFFVDPFLETHGVSENSNEAMNKVAREYRRIAQEADCAVSLVHHSRKTQAGDSTSHIGNADTSRGAGSVVGVTRVAHTLYPMTKKDADKYGIEQDQKHRYIRLDDAKANLSLATNTATWFEKHGQFVPFGTLGLTGDEVGVLKHVELSEPDEDDAKREEASTLLRRCWRYVNDDGSSIHTVANRLVWGSDDMKEFRKERKGVKQPSSTIKSRIENAVKMCVEWSGNGGFQSIQFDKKKLMIKVFYGAEK